MARGKLVALLRGINVGTAKRIAMADLRELVEGLGYKDVRTLLNSGNVVFSGPASGNHARRIEEAIVKRFGFSARVIVLSGEELSRAIAENPLLDIAHDPPRLLVAVLADPADAARLKPLAKQNWAPEALAIGNRVVYMWCPDGVLASRVNEAAGRILGDAVTTRNWATMLKLNAL